MSIDLDFPGRMISFSKRAPEGHVCVWNANLCKKSKGKFWFGDIDLTTDRDDLQKIACDIGEDVYVLREHDARFDHEKNPRFENAVAVIEASQAT